ncbi:small-conductance mechanosensitive channel [Flavobacteriaceae bacterium UJ101]|nr:small-conductance mechanosensitive channel [Flavobacteriaceae bacterium UJ101]
MLEKLSPETLMSLVSEYGMKVLGGIVILIVGFWFAAKIAKLIEKRLKKRGVDDSLREFLVPLVAILLKILVIFAAAETVGFKTTSFIAVLGGAALAIGMALQGSLSNFAGGILILFFKPFKVGDLIESQTYTGFVEKIEVFNTILRTGDNKRIILPNGPVYNNPIVNFTENGFLRVEVLVGIGYGENIGKARDIIIDTVKNVPSVKTDMDITVHVSSLGASSVDLFVRCFTDSEYYWDVFFNVSEAVKLALDKENIKIPFPQREVVVTNAN